MARKTLTLRLDLENAAFAEGFGDQEAAIILKAAAARLTQGVFSRDGDPLAPGEPFGLRDTNGNLVGYVQVEELEESDAKHRATRG